MASNPYEGSHKTINQAIFFYIMTAIGRKIDWPTFCIAEERVVLYTE
jgi:hypothetical protein